MKKLVISIITMLSLVFSAVPAFAESANNATVTGDFQIQYNGNYEHFEDGNGDTVRPIILNGTTYLPVRAVAGLIGLNAEWDASTKTVKLTSGGEVVEQGYPYVNDESVQITVDANQNITITLDGKVQNVPAPFIYNGTTYLPVRAICDMVGIPVEWRADTKTVLLGTYLHEATATTIPPDAKVLTDKDMIDFMQEYKDGAFYVVASPYDEVTDIGIEFINNGYKTVTFTVTTKDVCDKHSQDVCVAELDSELGTSIATVPQAYGQTKTYKVDISGHNKIAVQVSTGMNSNAIISNVYLTK